MLGRYADNLYWMARYLERAENAARKIQAGLHYSITTKENNVRNIGIIYNFFFMMKLSDAPNRGI